MQYEKLEDTNDGTRSWGEKTYFTEELIWKITQMEVPIQFLLFIAVWFFWSVLFSSLSLSFLICKLDIISILWPFFEDEMK